MIRKQVKDKNRMSGKKRAVVIAGGVTMAACLVLSGCGSNETQEVSSSAGEETQETANTDAYAYDGFVVLPADVAEGLEAAEQPSFAKEDVRGIEVVRDGEVQYQLNYTPRDDRDSYLYWDMVTPYQSTAVVNTEEMYDVFDLLATLDFSTAELAEEGADTGIAESDDYILVNYYACPEDGEQQADPDHTMKLIIGNSDADSEYYYCALAGYEDTVYKLSVTTVRGVMNEDPYDMILKIPYLVNIASVKEVQISYNGEEHTMTLDGDTYSIDGKETEQDTYQTLFSDLMQPMITGEISSDEETDGEREVFLSITYLRNLDTVPDYVVTIYSGDSGYTIDVNGEENFILSDEDIETLSEALDAAF